MDSVWVTWKEAEAQMGPFLDRCCASSSLSKGSEGKDLVEWLSPGTSLLSASEPSLLSESELTLMLHMHFLTPWSDHLASGPLAVCC